MSLPLPLAEIERRAAMTAWRSARTAENRARVLRANLRLLEAVGYTALPGRQDLGSADECGPREGCAA